MILIDLFEELNKYLDIYIKAYTTYRLQSKKENVESKKKAALEQMKDALSMIEDIIDKIDQYYSNESRNFISDITNEDLSIINDEYIEVLNRLDVIKVSLELPSLQKYTDIMNCHKQLLKRFDTMENNIEIYNNQANLGFKIISPEEAHKYYDNMRKLIQEKRIKNDSTKNL